MELFFELLISIVYRTVPILSLNWGYYAKSLNVLYSLTSVVVYTGIIPGGGLAGPGVSGTGG